MLQVPGVVVMEITSADCMLPSSGGTSDPAYKRLVVVFNASPATQLLPAPTGAGPLLLHPELLQLQVRQGGCLVSVCLSCRAPGGPALCL